MSYINFNGKLITADTAIAEAGNRGLRYGDGLFETIKFKHNQFQLLEPHLERLWKGLHLMKFDLPKLFTPDLIKNELLKLVQKNKQTHARVRLTIIRGNGGLYDATDLTPRFIIESWPLAADFGQLNSNGLQLGIYRHALKPCDDFCNLKHNNFLPYLMGALFAKEKKYNDAIILNQHSRICDTTIANIFIIKNGQVKTPALPEGCIAGTMRRFLLQQLPAMNISVTETAITATELLSCDEIFVTNAISPIKWVASVDDHTLSNEHTLKIYNQLCKTLPDIFC
ncbi:MAG: aminotransferase class IV family protein [Rhizobacter sp.]|nr:aminotransferase class IV family protein [Ferruginibacter sp.]